MGLKSKIEKSLNYFMLSDEKEKLFTKRKLNKLFSGKKVYNYVSLTHYIK